nr:cobaltochelatase subunit CobN [uncultured Methanolobus sp.]
MLVLSITNAASANDQNTNIAFIVIGSNEAYMVNQAAEGMNADVTVYHSSRDSTVSVNYTHFDELDLGTYDAVFVYPNTGMLFLGADVRDEIAEAIENTVSSGVPVIDIGFGTGNVNLAGHPNIEAYCDNPCTENIKRLISYIDITFCAGPGSIQNAIDIPDDGIYHPDSGDVFVDIDSYIEWYSDINGSHHIYNPENITIALSFFDSKTGAKGNRVIDDTVRELESRGVNVIPAFRPSILYENTPDIFKYNNEWLPDAFIDFGHGVWVIPVLNKNTTYLQEANVPVINAMMYQNSLEEWEESTTGRTYDYQYQIPIMEIGGHIESIVVSAKTIDENYNVEVDTTIPEQLNWMINRTLNWVDLQKKEEAAKKVAVIYYNHAPGRQSTMTATNLDVAPSIANLLEAMDNEGYYLGENIPNSTEVKDLVLQQGRNIGNWAPGEMEYMVSNYDVELLPVEQYRGWFDELPEAKRNEVIDTWGEAPGDCMVYENESGKFFVFPKISLGNVMLVPQPTRGASADDSLVYHDQTLPPSHQYIAFYMWLDRYFEADAVVNMGRHGTQEWLSGKGTGLSIEDCWPAILLQDMPSIYIYDVGGIGEGIQAKRRGNAVIIDHLTPPIIQTRLYGNLSLMHQKMHLYTESDEGVLKKEYRNSIIELYDQLGLETNLEVSADDLIAYNDTRFENFVLEGPVHDYLHELASENMPYGLHILGETPQGDALVAMVDAMVSDDIIESIAKVIDDEHLLDTAHQPNVVTYLLEDVLLSGISPDAAVMNRLNISGTINKEVVAATISDSNGNYSLENIPNGNYTIATYIYVPMGSTGMWFMQQDPLAVQEGEDITGHDITSQSTAQENVLPVSNMLERSSISGKTILPSRMGRTEPYGNINVLLLNKEGEMITSTISNSTGDYKLEGIQNGNYTITTFVYVPMGSTGMWFMGQEDNVHLNDEDVTGIDITSQSTAEDNILPLKEMLQKANISGKTILPSRMGGEEPYANVNVLLLDTDSKLMSNTNSNATGDYILKGIPNGNYTIATFVYVPMGSTGMWFMEQSEIAVQDGEDVTEFDITAQSTAEENVLPLSRILQRASISGKTILPSRMGGTSPYANVQVVLISETVESSEEAAGIIKELENAVCIASLLSECSGETQSILDALDGKYITPGLGDDPLRCTEALPTGRNFYSFNPNIIPTPEAWEVGKQLVDEFLLEWVDKNGNYPEKVGFVLWSSETGRHKGVMESEILYLMGIEPIWDSSEKVDGVKLIDCEELGRPRIDVVVTMSGVYRDEYTWQVELMDRAARMAASANDSIAYPNYIMQHSDSIYDKLMETGSYTEEQAALLSECRIFGPATRTWGVGEFASAVERADSWNNESILADLYVNSMSNPYGENIWGGQETDTFREVLSGTDALLFSRSGNDNRGGSSLVFDHVYEFYGGFASAVRDISGEDPAKFIVDMKDPDEAITETFGEYLATEMLSKYYNPDYISGLMDSGYAGASELASIFEDLAGLEYTLPDDITDQMWEGMYNIYIEDAYDLGLNEWYAQENPWAKQAIETKMLEVIRKGNWDSSDELKQELAMDIVESVAETGTPSCCHHTCGNILSTEYIISTLQGIGKVDPDVQQNLEEFKKIMEEATGQELDSKLQEQNEVSAPLSKHSGSSTGTAKVVSAGSSNQTKMNEEGAGMDLATPVNEATKSTPDNYVEGYEMTKERVSEPESSSYSISGSDVLASALVIGLVGAMYIGFWRRRKF